MKAHMEQREKKKADRVVTPKQHAYRQTLSQKLAGKGSVAAKRLMLSSTVVATPQKKKQSYREGTTPEKVPEFQSSGGEKEGQLRTTPEKVPELQRSGGEEEVQLRTTPENVPEFQSSGGAVPGAIESDGTSVPELQLDGSGGAAPGEDNASDTNVSKVSKVPMFHPEDEHM